MSKRKSEAFRKEHAKKARTDLNDRYESLGFSGDESTTVDNDTAIESTIAGGGGVGGSGDMPVTNINNPFSGKVIIVIPDVMALPATLTFENVWAAAKLQHDFVNRIDAETASIQMTVTKVTMYGASAGIITLKPCILLPSPGPAVTNIQFVGQQKVDVGTISRKPVLSHYFGDDINSTRFVGATAAPDPLLQYQYVQKAVSPVPVDAGYLRVSFIMRTNSMKNLDTIFPDPVMLAKISENPSVKIEDLMAKSNDTRKKKSKIRHLRELTMPTLDK